MAASRVKHQTNLSSSIHERQQTQARIRALQQRTKALHEELARSSSGTQTAMLDIERAYTAIVSDFSDQRDQLLRRLQHVKKDIKQSADQLDGVRRHLNTAQSFRLPKNSPRYSNETEVQQMNAMVDDIERVLHQIAQQLKQYRFIPSRGHAPGRALGTLRVKNAKDSEEIDLVSSNFFVDSSQASKSISLRKQYVMDVDIVAQWVIASVEKRIFLCDNEGEVRIFSYSRQLHRQPLLTERFRLSSKRLITSFAITHDYLIAFELDTQLLTLHTHHGALLARLSFLYEPMMIVRADYQKKNQVWACSRSRRQCYQLNLDHTSKQINLLDQLDFTVPIVDAHIDPIGISCDDIRRVAVHDANMSRPDRLILFADSLNRIISLDFILFEETSIASRVERIALVPSYPHIILILYTSLLSNSSTNEIVIVDISSQPVHVVCRLFEPNGVVSLDLTRNGEFVYTTRATIHKRLAPKMHVYRFIDD